MLLGFLVLFLSLVRKVARIFCRVGFPCGSVSGVGVVEEMDESSSDPQLISAGLRVGEMGEVSVES